MDFALIMFIALVITGVVWGLDRLFGVPLRRKRVTELTGKGALAADIEKAEKEPLLVEYARAFFPVILIVFLLRSFLVEPFRIPSGSMLPSLLVGDFILVNKFTYGIRIPIINKKMIELNTPQRGDVMVFRYPNNPSDNYIKRVIGLPGDRIAYRDKQLYVNGKLVQRSSAATPFLYRESERLMDARQYVETLDGVDHAVLLTSATDQPPMEFVVEPGHYFVMGDNRDHSNDSRYWGTVPEQNLVGKAFLIWFSWDAVQGGGVNWRRIGNIIH